MRWSSRRGMLEMDYYLQSFLEQHNSLCEEEKRDYEKLLNFNDNLIFSWLTKQTEPEDKSLQSILEKIRASARNKSQLKK